MFKKKPVFFPLFFALILLFSFITPVFAAEDFRLDPSVDLSDTAFDSAQQEEFNELVGNDEDTIDSVIIAAQHKGKDVSFEGVHADKCIKLYGLKNSGYALGALCDAYSETGRIQSMISEDYSVLTLYVNEDGQYIDSFVFVKSENDPEEHDINGWIAFGSGSLFADDTFMEEFLQEGSFENCLKGLGLSNTKNLKVISFLPNLSRCFYFEQEGEEFLIPMQDAGLAEIKAFQVYRAGDIAENFWKPIFDYEMEAAEKFKEEHPDGMMVMGESIPTDLPPIAAVNLNSCFMKNPEPVADEKESVAFSAAETKNTANTVLSESDLSVSENSKAIWIPIAVGVGILFIGVVSFVFWKKRQLAR